MTNAKVVRAWLRGEAAAGENLFAREGYLYSYAMLIGLRQPSGAVRLHPGPTTRTTSRHISLARRATQAAGLEIEDWR